MAYFLGVDQGSNSSRAVLFDQDGRTLDEAAQKVTLVRSDDERAEYDAHELLASVSHVIGQVLSGVGKQRLEQVSACGIATQRSTVLAWKANGEPLSPALSWQDVRARDALTKLETHRHEVMQLTGLPLTPYYSASKMHWLLNRSDSVKQCARDQLRLSPLASYLLFHLLDSRPYALDFSNAQRTLLFDIDTLAWSDRLCGWFGVDKSLLPACKPMCCSYGRLRDTTIPVTAVCGDQNAAMYGLGAPGSGTALVNLGSGAFVLRELDRFSSSASQLTGIASADSQGARYMREATVNGAGNALTWAEQHWQIDDIAASLPAWLAQVTEPPVFLNTVGGLGTPWMRGGIPASFVESGDYSKAQRAVAVIESIVFMIQANLEIMMAEAPLRKLRVSGGLSKLDGLCQKLSDLSGLAVERPDVTEATARGVAWLAAGRPQRWHSGERGSHAVSLTFSPRADAGLRDRYRLFIAAIKRLLVNDQRAGFAR